MIELKIIGVVIGECTNKCLVENNYDYYISYSDIIPNKNIYKLFPDFPKLISANNELQFNAVTGYLSLLENKPIGDVLIFTAKIKIKKLIG